MGRIMKLHKTSLVCVIALIFTLSISNFHATEAAGFSIDLIHRDSLQSPSLHSSLEGVESALQRSFRRAQTLIRGHRHSSSPSADVVPGGGEYLMRFGLGSPKVQTLAIADTGSDLTWIQCTPCKRCFKQKAPLFDPTSSSTYKPVPCHSNTCNSLDSTTCNGGKATCRYMVSYGDSSYSTGEIATETITLPNNVTIPRVIIGCSHNDHGTFNDGTSGIVGLGGGKESLIRQMGPSIRGKFSYCLTPLTDRATKPSKMHFGDEAVVAGAGVATTPIVPKSPATYYYLTLQGMSVGSQRFNLDSSSYNHYDYESKKPIGRSEGNIIIDSGTTLTYLPSQLYHQVEAAVKRQVRLKPIPPELEQLSLCYAATEDVEKQIPEITAHFKGANVKLKHFNTFVRVSERSVCFAFTPSSSLAIYGNIAQMDFLIGYDLEKKTVSFKPTDCSGHE